MLEVKGNYNICLLIVNAIKYASSHKIHVSVKMLFEDNILDILMDTYEIGE